MFEKLGDILGQNNTGTYNPNSNVNYGQVLKTLGLNSMSNNDKKDMQDVNDISKILSMYFGGGIGGAGAAASGMSAPMMGGFGSTMMQ